MSDENTNDLPPVFAETAPAVEPAPAPEAAAVETDDGLQHLRDELSAGLAPEPALEEPPATEPSFFETAQARLDEVCCGEDHDGLESFLAALETAEAQQLLTGDEARNLRLTAERKLKHLRPLPNVRIDGIPEGASHQIRQLNGQMRDVERHDEVFLTPEQLNEMVKAGWRLALLPHIPHEHLPLPTMFAEPSAEDDLKDLPIPEDAHPEVVDRILAENENRRSVREMNERDRKLAEEMRQKEDAERAERQAAAEAARAKKEKKGKD